jgi:signal transduction histidine kinase
VTEPADSRIRRLLREVPERPGPEQVQAGLRTALDDPTLVLGLWDVQRGAYLAPDGAPVEAPDKAGGRVATPVGYEDRPLALLVHDGAVLDRPETLDAVVSAARMGIAKDRLQDELEAKIAELEASRARIVEAGDAERQRLERNLHDGAQQRLVTLSLMLRLAEARLAEDPQHTARLLEDARDELAAALAELRELAHGIHPAVLSDCGLEVALQGVATRTPLPVELAFELERRLPEPVEVAAYYVVCEALTNAVKHAWATGVDVRVAAGNGSATIEVRDDGTGGADVRGAGLRGLADRVEALGGRLHLESPPGAGTALRAEIPLSG